MKDAKSVGLPRIGFLGTGGIGRHRMEAIYASGEAEIAAIADISPENAAAAAALVPGVVAVDSLDDLLAMDLDGIVIATPSAAHADQAVRALEHGTAVFCQKPLARTARETERVVAAARHTDRLLGVDFSYRFTRGIRSIYQLVQGGKLGDLFAADLFFHNAYGPDKSWFYDPALSGGGCLMDLGSHLIDLALWMFDFPVVTRVTGSIFADGRQLSASGKRVEDYALATLLLEKGGVIRIACSWKISTGQDAVIESTFYGTRGSASFRNVNGSFHDFTAEHFRGATRELLATPPEEWGGLAAIDWVRQVASGGRYNPAAEKLVAVAAALDAVYRHAERNRPHALVQQPQTRQTHEAYTYAG